MRDGEAGRGYWAGSRQGDDFEECDGRLVKWDLASHLCIHCSVRRHMHSIA
jgi:hypothetical protein